MLVLTCTGAAWATDVDACPMNVSEPVLENARLVNGTLWVGQPVRKYPPEAYRLASGGGGYVLCTCNIKPCIRKCCMPNMAYGIDNKCTQFNESFELLENFTVSSLSKFSVRTLQFTHIQVPRLFFLIQTINFTGKMLRS